MSRKKSRRRAAPPSGRAGPNAGAAEKKHNVHEGRSPKSGGRRRLIGGIAGTAAAAGFLLYFLVIGPGRRGVKLPGVPSLNVLLITLDTVRADHLGCYGNRSAKTPSLDGLARGGIRFARAYCPAPLTLPSHCSIMAGLYPLTHGVRNNGHDLTPGIKTLAEILKGHGYATAAFVSSFSVDSRFGLDRGFDVYDDMFPSELPVKSQNAERRAEQTFARFSRWLDKNSGAKHFCWVHYYDPHLPYDPPSPYREEFEGRPYDGEIAYMDHYVGAVLERLKDKGIFENTLVVVAGDHGEGFGDKVEIGHGIFLYEETLRVPLIFHHPGIFRRPRVVDGPVRLIDAAPTILDILGLNDEAADMQGQSLIAGIGSRSGDGLDSLVESFYPRENFGWSELVGLVSGSWKFILSPRPELYDLENDPEEKKNLIDVSADKARALKTKLEQGLLGLSSGRPAAGEPAKARPEDLEKLGSLGYVNFAPSRPGSAFPDPKNMIGMLRLIQQAQAYEFEDKYVEAEQVDLQILAGIPDSPASYINLAIAQARQKKFDRAIDTLKRGTVRIPDSEILLSRLGHTYLVAGKLQGAFETMGRTLALNPRNVDALTVSAGILDIWGRKDEARAYYERALAVEPESRYLRMSYAGNLAYGGRLREAIEVYKSLIEDFPEEQAFYQYAGIAYSYLGEFEPAIRHLEQAVAIRPTPVGFFNLAVACEKSGRLQDAIKYLRLYLENSGGESEINVRKARAELDRLEKQSRPR